LEKRLRAIQVLTNGPIFPLRRRSTRIVRPANFRISAQPADDRGQVFGNDQLLVRLRQQVDVSYRAAYQKLIDAANHSLTRPLKNGFRMEGHIASASLDRVLLLSDGMTIALRVTGELKML
jgi:hypothetical protein